MGPRPLTIPALACALAAIAAGASASWAASPARIGSAPPLPGGTKVVGTLPSATQLNVTVALVPRDPAALQTFAEQVSTPGSSVYHQYVTPAEFAQRFGATPAAIEAVDSSLRAHGLEPGPLSANGLSIPVSATAGQLESAFSLSFDRLALPSGRTAVATTAAPLVDSSIAGLVQGVVGLSSVSAPRPLLQRTVPRAQRANAAGHVVTGGPQPCVAAQQAGPANGAYTTDQVAAAYGFSGLYSQGDLGAGETIAVYELEPYSASDIAAYQSCYGTHVPIANVAVDGGAGNGPGTGEAALDIEQTVGLAPGATVLVYEGPNANSGAPGAGPYDTWSAIVNQDRAQVVTGSWGQCEALEGSSDARAENTLFQEAAAQGQTLVAASGDNGSEDCDALALSGGGPPNTSLAVDDPASQPFMTGVGGTTLSALGPRPSEQVWNNRGNLLVALTGIQPGASGGGLSSLWGMPSYQSSAAPWLHAGKSQSREVPDVSADADPASGYVVYWNGSGTQVGQPAGWQGIGGTSGGAPLWAALLALINASASCQGNRVGFANPALYSAASAAYGGDFNDITAGNNDFTGTGGGQYGAGAGYDLATGLGTPFASSLQSTFCTPGSSTQLLLIGNPSLSRPSLSGVKRGRPMLAFTVNAGRNAPALKTFRVRLSGGVHVGRNLRRITITGPQGKRVSFSATVRRGVLAISLRNAKTAVRIRIGYPALAATRSESRAARRGRAGKLRVTVSATDTVGLGTQLAASVRPRG